MSGTNRQNQPTKDEYRSIIHKKYYENREKARKRRTTETNVLAEMTGYLAEPFTLPRTRVESHNVSYMTTTRANDYGGTSPLLPEEERDPARYVYDDFHERVEDFLLRYLHNEDRRTLRKTSALYAALLDAVEGYMELTESTIKLCRRTLRPMRRSMDELPFSLKGAMKPSNAKASNERNDAGKKGCADGQEKVFLLTDNGETLPGTCVSAKWQDPKSTYKNANRSNFVGPIRDAANLVVRTGNRAEITAGVRRNEVPMRGVYGDRIAKRNLVLHGFLEPLVDEFARNMRAAKISKNARRATTNLEKRGKLDTHRGHEPFYRRFERSGGQPWIRAKLDRYNNAPNNTSNNTKYRANAVRLTQPNTRTLAWNPQKRSFGTDGPQSYWIQLVREMYDCVRVRNVQKWFRHRQSNKAPRSVGALQRDDGVWAQLDSVQGATGAINAIPKLTPTSGLGPNLGVTPWGYALDMNAWTGDMIGGAVFRKSYHRFGRSWYVDDYDASNDLQLPFGAYHEAMYHSLQTYAEQAQLQDGLREVYLNQVITNVLQHTHGSAGRVSHIRTGGVYDMEPHVVYGMFERLRGLDAGDLKKQLCDAVCESAQSRAFLPFREVSEKSNNFASKFKTHLNPRCNATGATSPIIHNCIIQYRKHSASASANRNNQNNTLRNNKTNDNNNRNNANSNNAMKNANKYQKMQRDQNDKNREIKEAKKELNKANANLENKKAKLKNANDALSKHIRDAKNITIKDPSYNVRQKEIANRKRQKNTAQQQYNNAEKEYNAAKSRYNTAAAKNNRTSTNRALERRYGNLDGIASRDLTRLSKNVILVDGEIFCRVDGDKEDETLRQEQTKAGNPKVLDRPRGERVQFPARRLPIEVNDTTTGAHATYANLLASDARGGHRGLVERLRANVVDPFVRAGGVLRYMHFHDLLARFHRIFDETDKSIPNNLRANAKTAKDLLDRLFDHPQMGDVVESLFFYVLSYMGMGREQAAQRVRTLSVMRTTRVGRERLFELTIKIRQMGEKGLLTKGMFTKLARHLVAADVAHRNSDINRSNVISMACNGNRKRCLTNENGRRSTSQAEIDRIYRDVTKGGLVRGLSRGLGWATGGMLGYKNFQSKFGQHNKRSAASVASSKFTRSAPSAVPRTVGARPERADHPPQEGRHGGRKTHNHKETA